MRSRPPRVIVPKSEPDRSWRTWGVECYHCGRPATRMVAVQWGGATVDMPLCEDCPAERHTCRWCGEPFTAKRSDARYCSARCKQAAHRARRASMLETGG